MKTKSYKEWWSTAYVVLYPFEPGKHIPSYLSRINDTKSTFMFTDQLRSRHGSGDGRISTSVTGPVMSPIPKPVVNNLTP